MAGEAFGKGGYEVDCVILDCGVVSRSSHVDRGYIESGSGMAMSCMPAYLRWRHVSCIMDVWRT